MPAERFFCDQFFDLGDHVLLEEQEFHHAVRVMRLKVGDGIELVNGQGQLARAVFDKVKKHEAQLVINELENQPKPSFEVILAQAVPRFNRLDFIVEKGTELGITQLWMFPGKLSERDLVASQHARLRSVAIAAMKQCGRLHLPMIIFKPLLEKWTEPDLVPSCAAFFGDIKPKAPLFSEAWHQNPPSKGMCFFVGPESGFTEQEEEKLLKLKAYGVKLHENILRTDTASLVALSLATHWHLEAAH